MSEDIRELLEDAVAGVEPRQGLDAITSRTGRGRRRSWAVATAGAVVATAAVIAGVTLVGGLPGATGTDDGGPASAPAPTQRSAGATDTDSPVFISSPTDGAQVTSPFTVTGKATAFEGNVQWELEVGSTVVRHGFTTAKVCCTLSPYSFTVNAPPGTYTLVVHDEDVSDGEGAPPARDTIQVRVQ